MSEDTFNDLLGNHQFTKKNEPKTIKDMRKELDATEMDPEKLKVI